ncbi:helix-hairpin-helix domain-containing protein [Polycladomyces sp. WAk]|uniref:Helix-hairpin-helix domain-containing protein n=1 Tax=Polycladomyces zharkentensis TaxID=2807616 RepID=A0ABS2WGH5_9BACL|nr:helix-hairpin-helix domain-containing protein [Polycladomyces sp. WAk]
MWEEKWYQRIDKWALATGVLALVVIGLIVLLISRQEETASVPTLPAYKPVQPAKPSVGNKDKATEIVVDVKGAINHPGVYKLSGGSRVLDAMKQAGGAAPSADLNRVNLAQPLADGMVVYIPRKGEQGPPPVVGASVSTPGGGTQKSTTDHGGKISLNSATAEQLDQLDGIGPSKAAAIIRYREEHGPFRSVDELANVPGIGEKTLAKFRDRLTVP